MIPYQTQSPPFHEFMIHDGENCMMHGAKLVFLQRGVSSMSPDERLAVIGFLVSMVKGDPNVPASSRYPIDITVRWTPKEDPVREAVPPTLLQRLRGWWVRTQNRLWPGGYPL
jgi:hypothetical protein